MAAASFAFILLQVAPGDPYSSMYQVQGMTAEAVDEMRARYGYNEPVAVQYLLWLKAVAVGNLGTSESMARPVTTVLASAIPYTLLLMVPALVASVLLGVWIGQWQAVRADTPAERVASTVSFVVYSMPEFWLAVLLLLVFSETLGWFPTSSPDGDTDIYLPLSKQIASRLQRLVLPVVSLTIVGAAVFARYQRAAMREVLTEPFVANARARGLPERAVLRHARRASLTPVITLGGLFLPALVGGAIFVETVFSWPGMGLTMVGAVGARDYPLVAGIVILGSALTVVGSLAADILREVVDPRARVR